MSNMLDNPTIERLYRYGLIFSIVALTYLLLLRWDATEQSTPNVYDYDTEDVTATQEFSSQPLVSSPVAPRQNGPEEEEPFIAIPDSATSVLQSSELGEEELEHQLQGASADIGNGTLNLSISLHDGAIIRSELLDFPVAIDSEKPVRLLNKIGTYNYYARTGWLDQVNGNRSVQLSSPIVLQQPATDDSGTRSILLSQTTTDDSLEIRTRYSLKAGSHSVLVSQQIINTSDEPRLLRPVLRMYRNDVVPEGRALAPAAFTGIAWYTDDDPYNKVDIDEIAEDTLYRDYTVEARGGWIAMVQHYFTSAWIPAPDAEHLYQVGYRDSIGNYARVVGQPQSVAANSSIDYDAQFYSGPKDPHVLKDLANGLDLTVDYGWLWWIGQPIYEMTRWLQGIFGNWGIAIIFMTAIIKLLIYPLSAAGFRSMAKMRMIAPQVTQINDRYKGDRTKIAQETMDLYKKTGVNPLGGCLPLLVPLPIFLALYWVLQESVELRHAPFILWIQDLSAPDPYFVLPILMGISMWVTQKLSPSPATMDPMQKRMLEFMPVVFALFSLWFPAGLVLYWFINNLLSIAQQWWIYRQLEKEGLRPAK